MDIAGFMRIAAVCAVLVSPLTFAEDAPAGEQAGGGGSYKVHAGDTLRISVWKEEDLQQQVLVRPDGWLSFPLVGEVDARGKTVNDLRLEISAKLDKFIPDPAVNVAVLQTAGNKIYVVGKVNRPGEYVLGADTDVMQALGVAGGTSSFASLNNIRILRRVDGVQSALPFRYSEVERGDKLEQNILLQSGDTVVVP